MKKEYLYAADISVLDSNREKTTELLISYCNNQYYVHHHGVILAVFKKLGNASKYLYKIIENKNIPHYKYHDLKIDYLYYGTKTLVNKNYEKWIF